MTISSDKNEKHGEFEEWFSLLFYYSVTHPIYLKENQKVATH